MPDLSSAQTKYLSRLKREKYFVNISRLRSFSQAFWFCGKSLPRVGWIDSFIFSSPSRLICTCLVHVAEYQSLFAHIGITLTETLISFSSCE